MKKNLLPGGFPELNPLDQAIEDLMKEAIRKIYERYGFLNIETPAVESNHVLTAKGGDEVSKQIFGLYGLKQGPGDLKDYSLRFDLTVPLARYVVQREDALAFPFKRYQIQKVWRGERQQQGRFKEFTQCDIDVIGSDLEADYEIEIIEMLDSAIKSIFRTLKVEKRIEIHVNNKRFLDALSGHFEIRGEQRADFYRLLDDFHKIKKEEFISRLKGITTNFQGVADILESGKIMNGDPHVSESLNAVLTAVDVLKNKGINAKFDPFITRGLDYYTGIVFETFIVDHLDFGSICSGGRYDNLVNSMRDTAGIKGMDYGGIGGSIGLTRLFFRLTQNNWINIKPPLVKAMLFNIPGSSRSYVDAIARTLRDAGISTDVYYNQDKLPKQFRYAESKNILFGIFAGPEEEKESCVILKNLHTKQSSQIEMHAIGNEIMKRMSEYSESIQEA